MQPKLTLLISVFFSFFILTGCGSSSPVSTGVYKDAGVVSGLQYQTATQSGVTDAQGRFKYLDGEKVTFSVSNVTLGQATGAAVLTTFDLRGITPPKSSFGIPSNNTKSNQFLEVVNISLLLQTLDEDGSPGNGIQIPALVQTVVAPYPLNFTWHGATSNYGSSLYFSDSPPLKLFIGRCRTAGAWGGTKAIQKSGQAANRLYAGLGLSADVYLKHVEDNQSGHSDQYEYDDAGQLITRSQYASGGALIERWTFAYDARGNLARSDYISSASQATRTEIYTYDANGFMTQVTNTTSRGIFQSTFINDANGFLIQQYDHVDGTLTGKSIITLNDNGTRARLKYYDGNNQLTNTYDYTYNSQLLQTSAIYTNNLTDETYWMGYEFDDNNKVTREIQNNGSTETIYSYTHDALGNISTMVVRINGSLTQKSIFEWDGNGLLLGTRLYNGQDEWLQSYAITYDAHGNPIQFVYTGFSDVWTTTRSYVKKSGWIELLMGIFQGAG